MPHDGDAGPSLTERAYETIKRKIITLEYRPGQYLNEAQVCKKLGIGRTPVHQAFHRLMNEGMVEIIPRKGMIVRPNSLNEVLALLEARWVIEPYCAGLAATRASSQDIAILGDIMQQAEKAAARKDSDTFMSLDVAFHSTLTKIGRNPFLGETLRNLHDLATRIWYLHVWQKADMLLTYKEHFAVFKSVRSGDKEGAARAMQDHLTSLRRRILAGAN